VISSDPTAAASDSHLGMAFKTEDAFPTGVTLFSCWQQWRRASEPRVLCVDIMSTKQCSPHI